MLSRKSYSGHDSGAVAASTEATANDERTSESLAVGKGPVPHCSYNVLFSPNREVDVDVVRDIKSVEDLRNYHASVLKLASELKAKGKHQAPMVLTFKRPVSPAEFRDFVKKHNLTVETFETRAIDDRGDKITIGGEPEGTEIFPQETFNIVASWSKNSAKLSGVTSFDGVVSMERYDELSSDPLCFLADVLPAKILDDVKPLVAQKGLGNRPVDVNVNDLFWVMEEFQP